MQLRWPAVQFVLGHLILRIVQTLPLCLLDMSYEIHLLLNSTSICVVVIVLQFIKSTLDAHILFWSQWWGPGVVTLLLPKASGHFLVPYLYSKISLGNCMLPETFGQKHRNAYKTIGRFSESNQNSDIVQRARKKKIFGCKAQDERACVAWKTLTKHQGRVSSGCDIVLTF